MTRTVAGGARFGVIGRAPTGIQPKSVQVSPNGRMVYVCNFGRPGFRTVTVHDPDTLQRVRAIEFEGNAVECVFRHDSSEAFVSNFRRRCIEQIDTARGEVVREIRVGPNPKTMALSPDERTLYVTNWSARRVSIVDLESGRERGQIETGRHPRGMAVGREGNLYVGEFEVSSFTRPGASA